jgi:hypothetical protein
MASDKFLIFRGFGIYVSSSRSRRRQRGPARSGGVAEFSTDLSTEGSGLDRSLFEPRRGRSDAGVVRESRRRVEPHRLTGLELKLGPIGWSFGQDEPRSTRAVGAGNEVHDAIVKVGAALSEQLRDLAHTVKNPERNRGATDRCDQKPLPHNASLEPRGSDRKRPRRDRAWIRGLEVCPAGVWIAILTPARRPCALTEGKTTT